jgi:hypothetical protein
LTRVMSFELSCPHGLVLPDARARLHALGDYLSNKYGLTVTWTGEDEASVSGSYLDAKSPASMPPLAAFHGSFF